MEKRVGLSIIEQLNIRDNVIKMELYVKNGQYFDKSMQKLLTWKQRICYTGSVAKISMKYNGLIGNDTPETGD
ncbi:MAG: hypothetical protein PHI41_11175 [Erysipelotrichaceae bacterium]|nr:hypothetical protein [Erysipelotrichaceae bacterium]MDD3809827.1 hypothetical protein [Erysipelotrichaceae bacterium]